MNFNPVGWKIVLIRQVSPELVARNSLMMISACASGAAKRVARVTKNRVPGTLVCVPCIDANSETLIGPEFCYRVTPVA